MVQVGERFSRCRLYQIGVIVYTGAGHAAFCTGGDVKEYETNYTRLPRDYWKYMGLFKAYIESIVNAGKPVIARLNGMAIGGGNESQLACDLSVMAGHAFIAQVGTNVGSVACGGSTQWLPITVGERRAREILMLNERIPAYQALEWGPYSQSRALTDTGANVIQAAENAFQQALKSGNIQIDKENQILFPSAQSILSEAEVTEVAKKMGL